MAFRQGGISLPSLRWASCYPENMMNVTLCHGTALCFTHSSIEGCLTITFHRTLRVPDDGKDYPLPPSLGPFPIRRVQDYADRVPSDWLESAGVFLPLYQREAMWIQFDGRPWHPNAVKVGAGGINAVSGEPWSLPLRDPQDYLVCPPQPWLDGFNTGVNSIRQFVAAPLGQGLTVEGQLTGREVRGGIQLLVCAPKRGRFPARRPCPPPAMHRTTSILATHHAESVLERLVEKGVLKKSGRKQLEARARKSGRPVLRQVEEEGLASESELLEEVAACLGLRTLGPDEGPEEGGVGLVPEHLCLRYRCVPLRCSLNRLWLATANPLDILALDDITLITGFEIEPVLASESRIEALIEQNLHIFALAEVEETVKDLSVQDFGPMGLGCGGTLEQQIFPDPYPRDIWSRKNRVQVEVHLVNSHQWTAITGEPLPPTPVTAARYTQYGYPWFEFFDADRGDLPLSPRLAGVRPIPLGDLPVSIPLGQLQRLPVLA